MKTCPYCLATNRDDATACYSCGRDMLYATADPAAPPSRTQPVRTRPDATQPMHYPPPAQPAQPQPGYGYPNAPVYPPAYPPQQPNYPPPPPPAPPPDPAAGSSPFLPWPVMIGTVVLLILCVCGLASWGFTSAAFGGGARLSDRVSTQVANVFPGAVASETPTELPDTPTPWPTFTPAPTQTPLPTDTPAPLPSPTSNPTQEASLEKLLSPECKAALDSMQQVSSEASTNPASLLDSNWRDAFGRALDAMKTSCGTLESASPVPGEISDVRQNLDNASQSFDQAKKLFNEGVDQRNPGKFLESGQELQKALDYLGKAMGGLRKIGQ